MIRRDPPGNDHLDAEERALADALRRGLSHAEPSPDLDARILAMARAEAPPAAMAAPADNRTVEPRRTRRFAGWPAFASAAAVGVLAAGLGWRLWPAHMERSADKAMSAADQGAPAAAQAMDHQGMTAATGPSATEETAVAAAVAADAAPVASAAPPPRMTELRQAAPVTLSAPDTEMPADTAAAAEPTAKAQIPAPPTISDTASPMARTAESAAAAPPAPAAPPPPPSAPPAPPVPARQALESITVSGSRVSPASSAPPVDNERAKTREQARPAPVPAAVPATASEAAKVAVPRPANQAEAASTVSTENGYDARPPVTVQDSGVRDAWLKRIRELMTHGDRDAARTSLLEFRSRYPDVVIPADLQPLLAPVK